MQHICIYTLKSSMKGNCHLPVCKTLLIIQNKNAASKRLDTQLRFTRTSETKREDVENSESKCCVCLADLDRRVIWYIQAKTLQLVYLSVCLSVCQTIHNALQHVHLKVRCKIKFLKLITRLLPSFDNIIRLFRNKSVQLNCMNKIMTIASPLQQLFNEFLRHFGNKMRIKTI